MSLELSDLINRHAQDYIRENMYVHIPAKVINVDNYKSNNTIDVLPCVSEVYRDQTEVQLPKVKDVIVVNQSGGDDGLISFPIKVGNMVMLLISDRSLEEFKASDGSKDVYRPNTRRSHYISDAVALTGMFTELNNLHPNPTDVEIKFKGSSIKLKPNGDIDVLAAKDLIASVTANASVTVGGNAEVLVGGNLTSTVVGSEISLVGGTLNSTVTGLATVTATGGLVVNTPLDAIVTAGNNITLTATNNITLAATNIITTGILTNNGKNIGNLHYHVGSIPSAIPV